MSTTSASLLHLSRRVTVLAALALALFGSAVFTAAASANFTLNSGRITLTEGGTTGNPPAGSWVALPSDHPSLPTPYFTNPSSTWVGTPDTYYTRIVPGPTSTTGLTLGSTQPTGGIIGSQTDLFNGLPWDLVTVGVAPSLTFAGNHSDLGPRALTGGNLTGLRVRYAGNTYTVGTEFGAGPHRIVPLTGSIIRSTTGTGVNRATIHLTWQTDLTEPGGFGTFRAHFQLTGTYDR
jgi:hypothetical protein